MVSVNYKVMIAGIIGLSAIYIALIICDQADTAIGYSIIGVIALITGVVIPQPKVNNKGEMKIW